MGESRAYIVPYYDIDTLSGHDNTQGEQDDIILFPWIIDQETTKVRGPIQFNIKFYKLTDNGSRYLYNLTTLTAESQILAGIYDNSVTDLVELGYISEETFNAYRAANISLYLKENDADLYYEAEIYMAERVYYVNQEEAYLATLKDDIYQKIHDIKGFDLYWEES